MGSGLCAGRSHGATFFKENSGEALMSSLARLRLCAVNTFGQRRIARKPCGRGTVLVKLLVPWNLQENATTQTMGHAVRSPMRPFGVHDAGNSKRLVMG